MLGFLFVCWLSFQDPSKLPALDGLLEMDANRALELMLKEHDSAYDYGLLYYHAGDYDSAARFFKHFSLKFPRDYSLLLGRANLHWAFEETEQAFRDADFLIRQAKDPLLLARAHMLMGQIQKWQENLDKARFHFEVSLKLYTKLDKKGGIFRALTGIALLAYVEGRTDDGDRLLERARAIAPADNPVWEARVFEIQSDSAYFVRDWAKTLYYSKRAYEIYTATLPLSALWHQSRMALCHAMLGDFDAAWSLGRSVDLKLGEMPALNQHIYHYHSLLWLLHARCSGYDVSGMRKSFLDWAKDAPVPLRELEFFENCDCPF